MFLPSAKAPMLTGIFSNSLIYVSSSCLSTQVSKLEFSRILLILYPSSKGILFERNCSYSKKFSRSENFDFSKNFTIYLFTIRLSCSNSQIFLYKLFSGYCIFSIKLFRLWTALVVGLLSSSKNNFYVKRHHCLKIHSLLISVLSLVRRISSASTILFWINSSNLGTISFFSRQAPMLGHSLGSTIESQDFTLWYSSWIYWNSSFIPK